MTVTTEIKTAADLFVWLERLAEYVPLHKTRVFMVVPHPDYMGPDADGTLAASVHNMHLSVGHTITLIAANARAMTT